MLTVIAVAVALSAGGQQAEDPVAEALIGCAPASLEAAMDCLDAHWPTREEYRELAYGDTTSFHMGMGMWMRNNWGLWGGGPLAEHFNGLGIHHPDDMSSIVLESYWLRMHDCPIRLDEQVAYYQAYWEQPEDSDVNEFLDTKPSLDCTAQPGADAL